MRPRFRLVAMLGLLVGPAPSTAGGLLAGAYAVAHQQLTGGIFSDLVNPGETRIVSLRFRLLARERGGGTAGSFHCGTRAATPCPGLHGRLLSATYRTHYGDQKVYVRDRAVSDVDLLFAFEEGVKCQFTGLSISDRDVLFVPAMSGYYVCTDGTGKEADRGVFSFTPGHRPREVIHGG